MTHVGPDHVVPQMPCPNCGAELDRAMSVGHDDGPSPGDATICAECATWSVFTEDLSLRQMSNVERSKLLLESGHARRTEWAVLEAIHARS